MPNTVVITDTSCLIALTKLNMLGLLHDLYRHVVITEEVYAEFGEELPSWVEVRQVSNKKYQQLLEGILDKGEASAIALALEMDNALLIIDDLKGRKEAKRMGIKMTGTLGVLFRAKQAGIISALKPYLEQLQACDFRIAPAIVEKLLRESNELT
jgi:predicted nucleic acid-binding protein